MWEVILLTNPSTYGKCLIIQQEQILNLKLNEELQTSHEYFFLAN